MPFFESLERPNTVDDYVLNDHMRKAILLIQVGQTKKQSVVGIRIHLLNTPAHLRPRMRTWVDQSGLDLIHNCIVNDRSDVLEFIFTKTEIFPQDHSPAKNPYAHLAACFGLATCLQVILKHRPMDFFGTSLPSHEFSLTPEQTKKLDDMSRYSGQGSGLNKEFKRLKKLLRDILLYCREEAWEKLLIDKEFEEQLLTSQADLSDVAGKFAIKKVVTKQELGEKYVKLPSIKINSTIETGSEQSITPGRNRSRTTIVLPDIPSSRNITRGQISRDKSAGKDVRFLGQNNILQNNILKHKSTAWYKKNSLVMDTTKDKTTIRKGTFVMEVLNKKPERPRTTDLLPKIKNKSGKNEQFKVMPKIRGKKAPCIRLHKDNVSICDLQGGVIKGAGKPLRLIEEPMTLKLNRRTKSSIVTNQERIEIHGFDKNTVVLNRNNNATDTNTVVLNRNNNATDTGQAVNQDSFLTEPETIFRRDHNHSNSNPRDSRERTFQDNFKTVRETSFYRDQNNTYDVEFPVNISTISLARDQVSISTTGVVSETGVTPFSLAAFRGHGDCIHVILDHIIGGETSLVHATEENSPLQILILLSRSIPDLKAYKTAVVVAIRMQLPSCLSILIQGIGHKETLGMRDKILKSCNLYHLLYSSSLHRQDGWHSLVEMTNMIISSGVDVNATVDIPGSFPLYTIVTCAFNQAPIHSTSIYLECFGELLNAGAMPTYNEHRKKKYSSTTGAYVATGFELECSRANFSSAIECILISARSSLHFEEDEEWCKSLMSSFMHILITSVPSGYDIDLIFKTYVLASAHLGFNAHIVEYLLRRGLDPSKEIDEWENNWESYAMNMYFGQILPYLVRNNVPDCFNYYKSEIDTLLGFYRRVSPRQLKQVFLSFFDHQTRNLPLQAMPIVRYFNHVVGQMLIKPRRLEELCALNVWDNRCHRNTAVLEELRLSPKLVSLILPKI